MTRRNTQNYKWLYQQKIKVLFNVSCCYRHNYLNRHNYLKPYKMFITCTKLVHSSWNSNGNGHSKWMCLCDVTKGAKERERFARETKSGEAHDAWNCRSQICHRSAYHCKHFIMFVNKCCFASCLRRWIIILVKHENFDFCFRLYLPEKMTIMLRCSQFLLSEISSVHERENLWNFCGNK